MPDQISDEMLEQVERLYGGGLPSYLTIQDRDTLFIKAAPYEGAPVQDVRLSPADLIQYYRHDNPLGCNGMSGCRSLGDFSTDWRTVDAIAGESLSVFRIINRSALEVEARKYGMELRDG